MKLKNIKKRQIKIKIKVILLLPRISSSSLCHLNQVLIKYDKLPGPIISRCSK